MTDLFWFGVTHTFQCPKCGNTSAEKSALSASQNNQAHIQDAINRVRLSCQICSAPLTGGAQVDVNVLSGTPEWLKGLGYPVPEDIDTSKKRQN